MWFSKDREKSKWEPSREKHVAIAFSFKVEELNLLLEILKLNFKQPPVLHVFCNANDETFNVIKSGIHFELIDHFHWTSEKDCYPGNTDKVECKRRQPIRMWERIFAVLGGAGHDFCFLEGDCYPLNEQKFYQPFDILKTYEATLNLFDFSVVRPELLDDAEHQEVVEKTVGQFKKIREGYYYPGTAYFRSYAAYRISQYLQEQAMLRVDDGFIPEGIVPIAIKELGLKTINFSPYFNYTYPKCDQIDPVNHVNHQHNIYLLADWFVKSGFDRGEWLERVLRQEPFTRLIGGEIVKPDKLPLEFCRLDMRDCLGVKEKDVWRGGRV